jgi:hypothetical protein
MLIDKEDIIIIIICIIISIFLMIYFNRHRLNFNCYKKNNLTIYKEELKNNSLKDNIKLIKNIENQDKDLELL